MASVQGRRQISRGGFDLDMFDDQKFMIDNNLVCPICSDVLCDGFETNTCGHLFCRTCIRSALTFRKECPLDRLPCEFGLMRRSMLAKRLIGMQPVTCVSCQQWKGTHSVWEKEHSIICLPRSAEALALLPPDYEDGGGGDGGDGGDDIPPAYDDDDNNNNNNNNNQGERGIGAGNMRWEARMDLIEKANTLFEEKKYEQAVRIMDLQLSGADGTTTVWANLAMCKFNGWGTSQDEIGAVALFRKILMAKVDPQHGSLAELRDLKVHIQLDLERQFEEKRNVVNVFQSLMALESYDMLLPSSEFILGNLFYTGAPMYGIFANKERGLSFYWRACRRGFEKARFWLGVLYSDGIDLQADEKLAFDLFSQCWEECQDALLIRARVKLRDGAFTKALTPLRIFERHHTCPQGLMMLSWFYIYGLGGFPRDGMCGERLQELAIRQGWVPHAHDEEKDLCPLFGDNCKQDMTLLHYKLSTQANRNNWEQQFCLAQMYDKGLYKLPVDGRKACHHYLVVVSLLTRGIACAESHYRLGCFYEQGRYIELDKKAAKQHFRQAMALDHLKANQCAVRNQDHCVLY